MRFTAFLLSLLLLPVLASGQISHGGTPLHWNEVASASHLLTDWQEMPALDWPAIMQHDSVTDTMKDVPWRFGIEHEVNWSFENAGAWTEE